jgi:broad specificity phosphatase PhoE
MKIYVVRHGETTGDLEDRYGGDYDDHLTPKGMSQAKQLVPKLKDAGIEVIFSSPRIRAKETAEIINKTLGVDIKVVNDLRERNKYGVLTGLTKKEGIIKFPVDAEQVKDDFNTVTGAESFEDFRKRAVGAFKEIINCDQNTILIVGHGGILRRIICYVLGVDKEIGIDESALLEIETNKNGGLRLIKTEGVTIK